MDVRAVQAVRLQRPAQARTYNWANAGVMPVQSVAILARLHNCAVLNSTSDIAARSREVEKRNTAGARIRMKKMMREKKETVAPAAQLFPFFLSSLYDFPAVIPEGELVGLWKISLLFIVQGYPL